MNTKINRYIYISIYTYIYIYMYKLLVQRKNCQAVYSSCSRSRFLLLRNWKTEKQNGQFFTGVLNHGTLEKNL